MTAPFDWNIVIDNIVALQGTGALVGSGIRFVNATPDAADEGPLPICFPSDDPGVVVNSWVKQTSTNPSTKLFRSKADYTLHWIELQVEIPQGITNFKKATYRPVIRENVSRIFAAISANAVNLGIEYVKPLVGSFDFNMTSPATGKRYLGATFSVECYQLADQTAA
jgi:hypothetical protein